MDVRTTLWQTKSARTGRGGPRGGPGDAGPREPVRGPRAARPLPKRKGSWAVPTLLRAPRGPVQTRRKPPSQKGPSRALNSGLTALFVYTAGLWVGLPRALDEFATAKAHRGLPKPASTSPVASSPMVCGHQPGGGTARASVRRRLACKLNSGLGVRCVLHRESCPGWKVSGTFLRNTQHSTEGNQGPRGKGVHPE